MKKFNLGFLALALVMLVSVAANAASFSILGDVGVRPLTTLPGSTGTLTIQYDPSPEGYSFANGGIRLELLSSVPGIISFSDATVPNGGRWTAATANSVTPNRSELEAFSILTSGLPNNAPSIFATVNYTVLAPVGITVLSLGGTGLDPLIDGEAGDVTANIDFEDNFISFVPEPGSMVMAGMALIGLAFRRRNG